MSAVLDSMGTADEVVSNELFFAPVSSDLIDGLLGRYQAMRGKIEQVAAIFGGDLGGVVHYFIEGNRSGDGSRYSAYSAEKIFQVDGAVAALNAKFWGEALSMTDVYDYMPQARRNAWDAQIRDPQGVAVRGHRDAGAPKWEVEPLPEFTEEAVRPTIFALLNSRAMFFAERVDGIFRGLSGSHVTNAPEAFGKRMIIAHVLTSYDTVDHTRAGLINDLRCVIAKFMGMEEPGWTGSDRLIRAAKERSGQWVSTDGGALRIKVFKVGTAHLEIHPDMAWRLNAVLAQMHPLAIPAKFRQKPKRAHKEWAPIQRTVPHAVLAVLSEAKQARRKLPQVWPERVEDVPNTVALSTTSDSAASREAEGVMLAIGGTKINGLHWQFDYPPLDTIREIVLSGVIPDQVSHQFYPTPEKLADLCVELADIGPADTCLEPSAGQGALATRLPAMRTTCVELSALHCSILGAKLGQAASVVCGDFLERAEAWRAAGQRFDRVVMNPPFSEGRAKLHAEAAAAIVAPDGRLVAVLPGTLRGRDILGDGFEHEWHGPYQDEFAGTAVTVTILVATRKAC